MNGTEELSRRLADHLTSKGLRAVTAWTGRQRAGDGETVAAVSLRARESGPPGFQNYLGERFDQESGTWEELYGKQEELTFGLDLYGDTAEKVQAALDTLADILDQGGPEGLRPAEFSAGETVYRAEERRYVCPVQARFRVWSYAVAREEGTFLDFDVRGANQK